MKKSIFTILILTLISISVSAQIRHVKGIRSVDAQVGISGYGMVYQLGYVKYFGTKFYGKVSGYYEMGEDSGVSYTSSGLDITAAYTFLKVGEAIYINGVGGLTFALDQLTEGAEELNVESKFKPGVLAGIEIETFITDKIVFVVGGNQRLMLGEEFGNYRYFVSGGFRFNF